MKMTKTRFAEIIEAYGANPARWPEEERTAAQDFAANNKNLAEKIINDARQLDQLLDTSSKQATDNNLLMARIMTAAQDTPQDGVPANDMTTLPRRLMPTPPWKSLAATLVLTTGIGFGIGQSAAAASDIAQAEALLALGGDVLSGFDWIEDLQ